MTMGNLERLEDKSCDLAIYYLEPLEEDEADEIEYLEEHNRELRDHVLRLEDIVEGTHNRRLLTQNHVMRGNMVGLEMKLDTTNHLRQQDAAKANKRIAILKAELNAANEALLVAAGSHDILIIETAMAYNKELVLGEVEMSCGEMAELMAEKITVPITVEA